MRCLSTKSVRLSVRQRAICKTYENIEPQNIDDGILLDR